VDRNQILGWHSTVFFFTIMAVSSIASAGVLVGCGKAGSQQFNPTISRVINTTLSVIPNGDFEDNATGGSGALTYPGGGWVGGAKNISDDTPRFSNDAYLHSLSWEQSLAGTNNSWKWIGYDFSSDVPDLIAFALKEVSGSSGNNLVNVIIEDHGQSPVVRMFYEFSTSAAQVRPNGWDGYANSYTYHEKIDLDTWYYRIKDWKADWRSKLGYEPMMHNWWRVALSIDSFAVESPIVARFDAIWLGNSIPNLIPNGNFEDNRIYGSGENASPSYWSSWIRNPGEGGLISFSQNSFSGSYSYEVTTVPVLHAFKGIYQDVGTNPLDNIGFAIYGVTLPTGNNLINVRIDDMTDFRELSYEFSTSASQVHQEWNAYQVARHEQIQAGFWYYRNWSSWKSDWAYQYGTAPDMSHNWRLVLLVENYFVSSNMTARYDNIYMSGTQTGGSGSLLAPILILSVVSVALVMGGLLIVKRRSGTADVSETELSHQETSIDTRRGTRQTRSMGRCMVCNLAVYDGEEARWCRFCGGLAHRTHLLEWVHIKGTCPICKNRLEEDDLR
jgi:hypothetical protein